MAGDMLQLKAFARLAPRLSLRLVDVCGQDNASVYHVRCSELAMLVGMIRIGRKHGKYCICTVAAAPKMWIPVSDGNQTLHEFLLALARSLNVPDTQFALEYG